jgi:site-specific recombinase XerD
VALWPLVQRYAEHMRGRQFKEKSIRGICTALHRFCAFMAQRGRGRITEFTDADLEAYQLYLLDLEAATQHNYLVNARLFLRWLETTGQLFENPAARLVIPRRSRKLVKAPSERQVALLLETPDTSSAVGLGARRIEIVRLAIQDLDLQ